MSIEDRGRHSWGRQGGGDILSQRLLAASKGRECLVAMGESLSTHLPRQWMRFRFRADWLHRDPRAPLFPAFTTTSENVEPEIYEPYPRHNSRPWRGRRKGRYKPCIGPRGEEVDIHPEDQIKGYTLPHDESAWQADQLTDYELTEAQVCHRPQPLALSKSSRSIPPSASIAGLASTLPGLMRKS